MLQRKTKVRKNMIESTVLTEGKMSEQRDGPALLINSKKGVIRRAQRALSSHLPQTMIGSMDPKKCEEVRGIRPATVVHPSGGVKVPSHQKRLSRIGESTFSVKENAPHLAALIATLFHLGKEWVNSGKVN